MAADGQDARKRDGLATGIRFVQAQGDPVGLYSQCQYIQQPGPLTGSLTGGVLSSVTVGTGTANFTLVDFTLGGIADPKQWLVQTGDYLTINNGGVYSIYGVIAPNMLQLGGWPFPPAPVPPGNPYFTNLVTGPNGLPGGLPPVYPVYISPYQAALSVTTPTTNYRIIRQARILIGEDPLVLPNNFAVDMRVIPGLTPTPPAPGVNIIPGNDTAPVPVHWSNVMPNASFNYEILFSPTGAVIGANAGNSKILLSVYDMTMNASDINDFMNHVGIIAIQSRTGYIGAYSANQGAGLLGYDPFYFAEIGRESGL